MRTLIIFLVLTSSVLSEEIFGFPNIIDGDTIRIENYKIRLEGIDAPEMKQKCKKEKFKISLIVGFTFYEDYNCGAVSKENLVEKIGSSKIKCVSTSQDRYKRYLATCFTDKINLNKWMVRNGHALAYKRYSNKYVLAEEFAKENKLGLWKGKFINPEKWRKLN